MTELAMRRTADKLNARDPMFSFMTGAELCAKIVALPAEEREWGIRQLSDAEFRELATHYMLHCPVKGEGC